MEDPSRVLVLLTATYPYGRRSETFLDDEIQVLARRFSQVIVVPSHRDQYVRDLPHGVLCDTSLADALCEQDGQLFKRHCLALRQLASALRKERRARAYLRHPRTYLHVAAQNIAKFEALKAVIARRNLREALFYDYWLENSTLALSWLRKKGAVKRAVARAHRFDLYDECWEAGAVPFRSFKVAALDRIFAISEHGLRYLSEQHPTHQGKLALSRLGVALPAKASCPPQTEGSTPVVVSCANLLPFKRVSLIPDVLMRIGGPLRWIHFGDGPEWSKVEVAARRLPSGVTWRLAGHVDHAQVLDFYRANHVDLFISLSASEGLPVSMMEAISYGIPLLGTDVGGVSEIVNARTGTLVRVDDPPEAVAAAARRLLAGERPTSEDVRRFFEATFAAERNFGEFASMLHAV